MERERRPARRGALVVAVLAALLLAAAAAPAARANQLDEIVIPDRNGEIPQHYLAYPGPPKASVLLPDGYDPSKQYPLLVLLAGANSNYRSWASPKYGNIAKTAAGFEGIIVMPEGQTGFYTDWWNGGTRGSPGWESYFMDEVMPQILASYPIRPERRWHALAGVSMGGLGTAYLGGRLPGFFGSIAILSGVPFIHVIPGAPGLMSLVGQSTVGGPYDFNGIYGPEEAFYAQGHDPVRVITNLAQTRVFMTRGNGIPTSDGEPNPGGITDPLGELLLVTPMSEGFALAARNAAIDLTYEVHNGVHDNANFRPELKDAIRWGLFKPVDEHATSWLNDTVATSGKLWEFAYRFDSPPDQVVRFRRNGPTLNIGPAGSPVTITTDGGCTFHVSTPAQIAVPEQPCKGPAASAAATGRRAKALKRCKRMRARSKKAKAKARKKCRKRARRLPV